VVIPFTKPILSHILSKSIYTCKWYTIENKKAPEYKFGPRLLPAFNSDKAV